MKLHIVDRVTITRRCKPWGKPGWELSCTGRRRWVERMMRRFLPALKKVQS